MSPSAPIRAPESLDAAIRYSLLAPGKRIRPRLCYSAALTLGLAPEVATRAALAIEVFHCFSLIHDDLPCMDDDDFRRGQPSNHRVHGEAMALLAGDALLGLSSELLLECSEFVPPSNLLNALQRFHALTGVLGVIGGQALELQTELAQAKLGTRPSQAAIEQIHWMKTAALFVACIALPVELSGTDPKSPFALALLQYGDALGRAFQIADDLEDLAQDQSADPTTAKSITGAIPAHEAAGLAFQQLNDAREKLRNNFGKQEQPEALSQLLGFSDSTLRAIAKHRQ